jgi:hypothetical protein
VLMQLYFYILCQSLDMGRSTFHPMAHGIYPGKNATKESILLSDFSATWQTLMASGQLFRGHAKFRNVYDTCTQLSL